MKRGGFRSSPKPCSSERIAICTVTPEGRACCSFDEGSFAYVGGLWIALDEARAHAERGYCCACVRRNIGVGVMIFSIHPNGPQRVIGVTRYQATAEEQRRAIEDREARSARVRLLATSIADFERGRRFERAGIIASLRGPLVVIGMLALALVGCAEPVPQSIVFHFPQDAALVVVGDAAPMLGSDAGVDVFELAPDVWTSPDASLDSCALVGPATCADGLTCRRALVDVDGLPIAETGPASCVSSGSISEGDAVHLCSPFDDQCGRGLFCDSPHVCARYCDPLGAACPDLHGSPQRCTANDVGVYRCAS